MAPTTRGMRARAAASSDRIPRDALFEALLRLPVKDLCRLRAVCRSWCAIISDPFFIAVHADCHRRTLFVAKFSADKTRVYVIDLSGNILRHIAGVDGGLPHQLLRTRLELACLVSIPNRCRVLNPATGAVHVLPASPAVEHENRINLRYAYTSFSLGRVSTGEHKVLRMINQASLARGQQQFFEVFTINGEAQWRGQQNPGLLLEEGSDTVVDGVVYFLTSFHYDDVPNGIRPDYIISFDLGMEEWRNDLRGPLSSNAGDAMIYYERHQLTLAELRGSLVLADHSRQPDSIELWFLVDFGSGLWVKEYRIQTQSIISSPAYEYHLKPLLVLDDGRLVIYVAPTGRLFICDPGNNTFERVGMRRLDSVGVYTGNLLSL